MGACLPATQLDLDWAGGGACAPKLPQGQLGQFVQMKEFFVTLYERELYENELSYGHGCGWEEACNKGYEDPEEMRPFARRYAAGYLQGFYQTLVALAREMLKQGCSIEQITAATLLSERQIKLVQETDSDFDLDAAMPVKLLFGK